MKLDAFDRDEVLRAVRANRYAAETLLHQAVMRRFDRFLLQVIRATRELHASCAPFLPPLEPPTGGDAGAQLLADPRLARSVRDLLRGYAASIDDVIVAFDEERIAGALRQTPRDFPDAAAGWDRLHAAVPADLLRGVHHAVQRQLFAIAGKELSRGEDDDSPTAESDR